MRPACDQRKFKEADAVGLAVRFIESTANEILANKGENGTWLLLVNDVRKWHRSPQQQEGTPQW